jgi:hypothetical protein
MCVIYDSALALCSSLDSEEAKFHNCVKWIRHEIRVVLVVLTMNLPVI